MYYSYLTKLIEEYKRARNIEKFNYFDANQNAMFREWLKDLKLSLNANVVHKISNSNQGNLKIIKSDDKINMTNFLIKN